MRQNGKAFYRNAFPLSLVIFTFVQILFYIQLICKHTHTIHIYMKKCFISNIENSSL